MPEPAPLVGRDAVDPADRAALATGAGVLRRPGLARYRLVGSARVTCLQGLVTCDVEQAGDGSHLFGALLTPKGMIVAPLWITRLADALIVEAPRAAATDVATAFERSLPPRLCRCEDVTAASASIGVYGPAARDVLAPVAGEGLPEEAGRTASLRRAGADVAVSRVTARGLDGFECLVPAPDAGALVAALRARGARGISPALLEERRILAGFPRLGAEIDDRTLPQEARLDDLGAVSYTKGCYLGQETVARVHFRGHPNRWLAGLALERDPASLPLAVVAEGEPAGRLSSACWWAARDTWVGLGVVRRSVAAGAAVELPDGSVATIRELPWEERGTEGAP
ncbi:MAG TPA: hypothetical protein VMF70_09120 [Gemmatimonadales bacterium]|nr:hypothetical protein [Gemmatimonadales bacterium]